MFFEFLSLPKPSFCVQDCYWICGQVLIKKKISWRWCQKIIKYQNLVLKNHEFGGIQKQKRSC